METPESHGRHLPEFARTDSDFLYYLGHDRWASTPVSEEIIDTVLPVASRILTEPYGHDELKGLYIAQNDIRKRVGSFQQGFIAIGNQSGMTPEQIEDAQAEYVIKMTKRDLFAQYMQRIDFAFEYSREEVVKVLKLQPEAIANFRYLNAYYREEDTRFQDFVGNVAYWINQQADPSIRGEQSQRERAANRAALGIKFFTLFNIMFPERHERRDDILIGLDVPPSMFGYLNILDPASVDDFLRPENAAYRNQISRMIANYFTDFNAHPWYNS